MPIVSADERTPCLSSSPQTSLPNIRLAAASNATPMSVVVVSGVAVVNVDVVVCSQNDIFIPESCDIVVDMADDDSDVINLDTAPVYGQLGVDCSGQDAVVDKKDDVVVDGSNSCVGAVRHLGGADDGHVGGNESERCFSFVSPITVHIDGSCVDSRRAGVSL